MKSRSDQAQATLWLKMSEETALPPDLSELGRGRLSAIFDVSDSQSLWRKAASAVGLSMDGVGGRLILWRENVPYVNWSAVVSCVTHGFVEVVPATDGASEFSYRRRISLRGIFSLVRSQWTMEGYLAQVLEPGSGTLPTGDDAIRESLALGLVALAMMLRLPRHEPLDLARWLSEPAKAPRGVRSTVKRLDAIQRRRTALSGAWSRVFASESLRADYISAPQCFWEGMSHARPRSTAVGSRQPPGPEGVWSGLPVYPGKVSGLAIILSGDEVPGGTMGSVLVFAQARPEAVGFYVGAAALVFAEGGVLSHACVVARERGIPCVTGLGRPFWVAMQEAGVAELRLSVDGATGEVRVEAAKKKPPGEPPGGLK